MAKLSANSSSRDSGKGIPARNKLKADIQKTLLQPEFSKLPGIAANRARIISRLMEIAEKNNDLMSVCAMTDLQYNIARSARRKSVTITVERDRTVIVRAPEEMSDDDVDRIVVEKRQWILEKLRSPQKYEELQHPPGKEVVNGESALYLGREYRIEIGDTESGKVEFSQGFRVPLGRNEGRREVLRDWYIEQAKEIILSRVARHATELGVTAKSATHRRQPLSVGIMHRH